MLKLSLRSFSRCLKVYTSLSLWLCVFVCATNAVDRKNSFRQGRENDFPISDLQSFLIGLTGQPFNSLQPSYWPGNVNVSKSFPSNRSLSHDLEPLASEKVANKNLRNGLKQNWSIYDSDENQPQHEASLLPPSIDSSLVNDSAMVEDIFNRFKSSGFQRSKGKKVKPMATSNSKVTLFENSDSDQVSEDEKRKSSDSVYFSNDDWFPGQQDHSSQSHSSGAPKQSSAPGDGKKTSSLFGMPKPGQWVYTKEPLTAEQSKTGSTESKTALPKENGKESAKAEVTSSVPGLTGLKSSAAGYPMLPHPMFDDQLIMASPHNHHPSLLSSLNPLPIPMIQNHLPLYHHHHPYSNQFLPHYRHRYPYHRRPIAYSCCKVIYPSGLTDSLIGYGSSAASILTKEASSIPAITASTASTATAETILSPNELTNGLSCYPIYPQTYGYGYDYRGYKSFPFSLKMIKRALLFG